jgi:hypothetical protein
MSAFHDAMTGLPASSRARDHLIVIAVLAVIAIATVAFGVGSSVAAPPPDASGPGSNRISAARVSR